MPLEPTGDNIRLLRFEGRGRSKDESGLRCSVVKASLSHSKYFALSYVWGDPTRSEPLIVNGLKVAITKNLSQALERFQADADAQAYVSGNQENLIWTDALCINQDDDEEKSAQVQRMDQIYTRAEAVLAWVGPSSDDSDMVIDECNTTGLRYYTLVFALEFDEKFFESLTTNGAEFDRFATFMRKRLLEEKIETSSTIPPLRCLEENPTMLRILTSEMKLLDSARGTSIRNAWQEFMNRDFWQRIWILQELILGKNIYMLCGSKTTKLEFFITLCSILVSHFKLQFHSTRGPVLWDHLVKHLLFPFKDTFLISLLSAKSERNLRLVKLVEDCGSLAATQSVDRIYGLLGIASDNKALGHQVDYSRTLPEICTDLGRRLIKKEGILALSYATGPPGQLEVPSWVTIFSLLIASQPTRRLSHWFHPTDFKFSAAGKTFQNFDEQNFIHSRLLRVHGKTVDKIARAEYVNILDGDQEIEFQSARKAIINIESLAANTGSHKSHRNGKTKPLWWIAVLHRDPDSADTAKRDEYLAWTDRLRFSYEALRNYTGPGKEREHEPPLHIQESYLYWSHMIVRIHNNALFVTSSKGFLGVGPKHLQKEDKIVIFHGGEMPFALRPTESGRFLLLGQVYVLGIMHGEFMVNNSEVEEFILE